MKFCFGDIVVVEGNLIDHVYEMGRKAFKGVLDIAK